MKTITIDIPDAKFAKVLAQLKKSGVKIRRSKSSRLDKLTKEDYQKHFLHQAKIRRVSFLTML